MQTRIETTSTNSSPPLQPPPKNKKSKKQQDCKQKTKGKNQIRHQPEERTVPHDREPHQETSKTVIQISPEQTASPINDLEIIEFE